MSNKPLAHMDKFCMIVRLVDEIIRNDLDMTLRQVHCLGDVRQGGTSQAKKRDPNQAPKKQRFHRLYSNAISEQR